MYDKRTRCGLLSLAAAACLCFGGSIISFGAEPVIRESFTGDEESLFSGTQEVSSTEDFRKLNLCLELPADPAWCTDISFSIVDQKAAQIQFYDAKSELDAVVRAWPEEYGDLADISYRLQELDHVIGKAKPDEQTDIYINVKAAQTGPTTSGVLAYWSYGGVRYSLWEEGVLDSEQNILRQIVGTAVEIARESARRADLQVP